MPAPQWWIVSTSATSTAKDFVQEAAAPPANAVAGPYPSQAAAEAALPGVEAAPNTTLPGYVASNAAGLAGNLLGLPHFTSAALRQYALRALKIVGGLILVIVGLAQLTHAQQLLPKAVPVPV
jgi:hypothetical protein